MGYDSPKSYQYTTLQMDFTNGEFAENLRRVESLIQGSAALAGSTQFSEVIAQDVLRAATVFLHSSLEEVIRNLYVYRLPNVSEDRLNKVPLLTNSPNIRPSQILLGQLASYKGQFVDNVIIKSIDAYTNTLNINNSNQLMQCLDLAEIVLPDMSNVLPALNELMMRRHQIVHQMDRANELDPLTAPLSPIDAEIVNTWKVAVITFVNTMFSVCDSSSN